MVISALLTSCSSKRKIVDAPPLPSTNISVPVGAIEVTVKNENGGFQLMREGKPYYIKGAGYDRKSHDDYYHLKLLADLGGNSIRTWGVHTWEIDIPRFKKLMDKAYEFGLTVDFGLWIDHERHEFDYNNEAEVEKRFQHFKRVVEEFKDHPALLMWNIGNEMTHERDPYNKKVFDQIGRVASMIREVDGKHPTLTTIYHVTQELIDDIQERAPIVDILGINMYSGVSAVIQSALDAGWDKPVLVTEFGPHPAWEVQQTKWGVPIESNGIAKAHSYKRSLKGIATHKTCLGSYAFSWKEHVEYTKTFYSLVFERGRTIPAVDELYKAWNGKYPENRAPYIQTFTINGLMDKQNVVVKQNESVNVKAIAKDIDEKEELTYFWVLREENLIPFDGAALPKDPPAVIMENKSEDGGELHFKSPDKTGQYRLYVRVFDSQGKICNGNFPFLVE